jgi:hypothetical protein
MWITPPERPNEASPYHRARSMFDGHPHWRVAILEFSLSPSPDLARTPSPHNHE